MVLDEVIALRQTLLVNNRLNVDIVVNFYFRGSKFEGF